jgi:hypothetical protein
VTRRSGLCKTCQHRDRAAIDLALARGISIPALAKRFDVSSDSLFRHNRSHLPPQLRAKLLAGAPDLGSMDLDALRETEGQSLLAHLVAIRGRLFGSLDFAEEHGDIHAVPRITSQLHQNLELTGKLVGSLGIGHTTVNNVLVLPQYVELRVDLINALRPFPDAAKAVAAVLHRLESKAAADIAADNQRETVPALPAPVA